MKHKIDFAKLMEKLEILISVVLFFVMLVTCRMYIDIKINGQSSSLPQVPPDIKEVLLKSQSSEKVTYSDDLIEPVFIGINDDGKRICATFDIEVRQSLENSVSPYLLALFNGTSEQIRFEDDNKYYQYVEQIKKADKYVLVSYYSDIPASVFLPCLSNDVHLSSNQMNFFVKHIVMLCDEDMNVYGLAFSSDKKVHKLVPKEKMAFDKITAHEYDINDGFSYFTFASENSIAPVFESSFVSDKYNLEPLSVIYGSSIGTQWIDRCFEVFSINENLVKSFSFKNNAEVIYVDDENELFISQDGTVEFKSGAVGVSLGKILEYELPENESFLFFDKIVAIKKIVNILKPEKDLSDCSIVGVDYDEQSMQLSIYLKYFVNGISVTENNYDAVFRTVENNLVYAKFYAFMCTASQETCVYVNQKYMNQLLGDEEKNSDSENVMYFSVLEKEQDGKLYVPKSAVTVNGNLEV